MATKAPRQRIVHTPMTLPVAPVPEPLIPAAADDAAHTRRAVLLARYGTLERELADAPFHRVNTFWWEERTKEMGFINQRLGK